MNNILFQHFIASFKAFEGSIKCDQHESWWFPLNNLDGGIIFENDDKDLETRLSFVSNNFNLCSYEK